MHYMELCVSTALYCADLDPTFPFDASPHPDPDLYLKLYTSWKVRIYFTFIITACQLLFFLLKSVIGAIIVNISDNILKFYGKKYGRLWMPISIRIWQNDVDLTGSRQCLFSIPDPGSEFFLSRIHIKEFKYFNPKNCFFLSSHKYDPGCSSGIRI
jgi:hypothetical protein